MNLEKDCFARMHDHVRMTGFLEKKGKMKLMSPWKKYWFVLEKRLLLYYRSETEYTNLSPCRGSLNMGLVTTVRPGSSTGPCVIHIVTRTQAIQLRAKNRAAQEEWLQALLHSMALPTVPKILKPHHPMKQKLLGQTSSLDNISMSNGWKGMERVHEWSLPRKLNNKGHINGTYYSGSLDTAIWSKKFMPVRASSPRLHQGKFLKLSKDSDSMSFVTSSQRDLRLNENKFRLLDKSSKSDEVIRRKDDEKKCKVHDGHKNRAPSAELLYGIIEKKKKIILTTFSDTEFIEHSEKVKPERRDYSPFEKIKNVLSRERFVKIRSNGKATGNVKKRRQSFLQKVFGRKDTDGSHCRDSYISDCLYDTIDNLRQQQEHLTEKENPPWNWRNSENTSKNNLVRSSTVEEKALYAEVRKNGTDPHNTSPDLGKADAKSNSKSIDILEKEKESIQADDGDKELSVDANKDYVVNVDKENQAPLLPPRRVSRPVSPWHDVPTNNAPIGSEKKLFFIHQAVVKFNDPIFLNELDLSGRKHNIDFIKEDIHLNLIEPYRVDDDADLKVVEKGKSDDLTLLLQQLTKITVAPLVEPNVSQNDLSEDFEKSDKTESPDPDYDIPRPHRPINHFVPLENELNSSTEHVERSLDSLEKNSLHSMEPDSLEAVDKNG
ncbi:hypothetical protein RUM44_008144 [Polyplax serrata]|uniref:PH domain-containing protein n=1 Tax=Polyplax serrata TaxID=468196 RepID=A0ABR1B7U0_POLSC